MNEKIDKKKIALAQTQSQIIAYLASEVSLTRLQVTMLLKAMHGLIQRHMKKGGSGEFKIPYIGIKVSRKTKPAIKKRQGIHPSTREPIEFAAKPKRDVVKITALKALKNTLV